ncbi:MAG: hypothetical protein KAY24_00100 [Candidatus Eisenbacteria sp.]|nr:hypothetical protein [Candidatus Eisenbacteria bacterium]
MAARTGMTEVITHLRRLVDDAGSAAWTDNQLEDELDLHRTAYTFVELEDVTLFTAGGNVTLDYVIPLAKRGWWERETGGTPVWRVYNYVGALVGTATYTVNHQAGVLTFSSDQAGSARYLDGRRYDVNGAAAALWSERAASIQDAFDFRDPSGSYKRSQWFDHCLRMAQKYEMLSDHSTSVLDFVRDDLQC